MRVRTPYCYYYYKPSMCINISSRVNIASTYPADLSMEYNVYYIICPAEVHKLH